MSSGKAKRARRKAFKEGASLDSLGSNRQREYVVKEASKLLRQMNGTGLNNKFGEPNQARAFPCQMLKGKYAYIPLDAKPEYNVEDEKWYLNGNLIVSYEYLSSQTADKIAEIRKETAKDEQAIKKLEPRVLGDE